MRRSSLLAAALLSSALLSLPAPAKDNPGWSVTKVAEGQAGPYCAVTRKVGGVVLTVGRTVAGQSSLAVDFGAAKLDPQKIYNISLKPGSAERLDLEARPTSSSLFVLNLENVVDLVGAFKAKPALDMKYDDQALTLSLGGWDGAARDVDSCLASFTAPAQKETKTAKVETPKSASPAKPVVDGAALADLQERTRMLEAENARLSADLEKQRAEANVARSAQPSAEDARTIAELQQKIKLLENDNIELLQHVTAQSKKGKPGDADNDAVSKLRNERDAMKAERDKALDELQMFKETRSADQQADVGKTQAINDLNTRIATLQAENAALKAGGDKKGQMDKAAADRIAELQSQLTVAQAEAKAGSEQAVKLGTLQAQVDRMQKENEDLKKQAQTAGAAQAQGVADELAKLKVEKATLQAQLEETKKQMAATAQVVAAKPAVDPEAQKKADTLAAEVKMLRDANENLKDQLALAKIEPAAKSSDMTDLQGRMEALMAENTRLRAEATMAKESPQDMKVSVAAEQPLRQQIRTLRGENGTLKAQVDELKTQLETVQTGSEKEVLKGAARGGDLEQTTRRLQEAERENRRLALVLRESRAQCDKQKKEIEYMLFDPKLAKEGQIALLNSLEDQLAAAKAGRPIDASAPVVASAAQLKGADADMVPSPPATVKAEALAPKTSVTKAVAETASPETVAALLQRSGLSLTESVKTAPKNPFGMAKGWTWETEDLAGLAAQQPAVKASAFDGAVSQKIATLKKFCRGDFAATPAGQGAGTSDMQYASYDAACIAGANSTSASLLFYQKNGVFTVISHETAPDSMDKAMEARDRVAGALKG